MKGHYLPAGRLRVLTCLIMFTVPCLPAASYDSNNVEWVIKYKQAINTGMDLCNIIVAVKTSSFSSNTGALRMV